METVTIRVFVKGFIRGWVCLEGPPRMGPRTPALRTGASVNECGRVFIWWMETVAIRVLVKDFIRGRVVLHSHLREAGDCLFVSSRHIIFVKLHLL